MLYDWLIRSGVVPELRGVNPAASVRGPELVENGNRGRDTGHPAPLPRLPFSVSFGSGNLEFYRTKTRGENGRDVSAPR